jgi:hypothetical protein
MTENGPEMAENGQYLKKIITLKTVKKQRKNGNLVNKNGQRAEMTKNTANN